MKSSTSSFVILEMNLNDSFVYLFVFICIFIHTKTIKIKAFIEKMKWK
jgi:hypothetical protein